MSTRKNHIPKATGTALRTRMREPLFKTIQDIKTDLKTCFITDHAIVQYIKRIYLPSFTNESKTKQELLAILIGLSKRDSRVKFIYKETWHRVNQLMRQDLLRSVEYKHSNPASSAKSYLDHDMQKSEYYGNPDNGRLFIICKNVVLTVHLNESRRWIPV